MGTGVDWQACGSERSSTAVVVTIKRFVDPRLLDLPVKKNIYINVKSPSL